MPFYSKEVKNALKLISSDPVFFIKSCCFVINKQSVQVPFVPNPAQLLYFSDKNPFKIILKARKVGFSTGIIADNIWRCEFLKNRHCVIVSHNKEATQRILEERVKPIIKSCLFPLGAQERKDYILFPRTNSRLWIGTAGSRQFGRGDDITDYHLTEFAHWEDPGLLTGIEEACTDDARGSIESTANGIEKFYELWGKAERKEGKYVDMFFPWWKNPEYVMPNSRLDGLDEEEMRLIEAFGVSHDALAWRRAKIASMANPSLFPQEYPSSPQEAFISSGRMVFDWSSLEKHSQRCTDPKWRGFLRDNGSLIEFLPQNNGNLSLWETPETRHVYIIGADIAEGLEDGCYSAAEVIDIGTGCQVAEWHGHIAPDRFGEVLVKLALYYNSAMLCPENNSIGLVTVNKILDLGYQNMVSSQRGNGEPEWGFKTTSLSKPRIITEFAGEAVRDYGLVIKSRGLVDELRTFVYDESGNMGPRSGSFSDRVMAVAIAWYCSRELASSVSYSKPKLREMYFNNNPHGNMTHPEFRGSIYGVRSE